MCGNPAELCRKARWSGALGGSRADVLRKLQGNAIPPSSMVPERRLESLIAQGIRHQLATCVYHNSRLDSCAPLFVDHVCDASVHFPSITSHVFSDHSDEVWHISFSHLGDRLAGCGKDGTTIIWDVKVMDSVVSSSVLTLYSTLTQVPNW
jgi:WD40 repeat protein